VDQCVVLATAPLIPASLVERALRRKEREFLPFAKARDRFEFEYLTHLLEMTEGNVAQAARLAERNRSEFYKLLHKHELEPELFRRSDADWGSAHCHRGPERMCARRAAGIIGALAGTTDENAMNDRSRASVRTAVRSALFAMACCSSAPVLADEGMWTFD